VDHSTDPAVETKAKAHSTALTTLTARQEDAVQNGVPNGHVIILQHAHHYVYLSNEEDIVREIRAFVSALK